MDTKQISTNLKSEAVNQGLCEQWTNDWSDAETQQTLIEKYKKGFDFCLERDWPAVEYMKRNFDRQKLLENLIFNDEYIQEKDGESGIWIINGHCSGELSFKGYSVATVYVRHDSCLTINASEQAIIFLRVHDRAYVDLHSYGNSKIKVIGYGESVTINRDPNIKLRMK